MHPSLAQHREDIAAICKQYGVLRLEVFGSAARGVDFGTGSDVDLLVRFGGHSSKSPLSEFFDFKNEIARLLGRQVDLSEDVPIQNPYLKRSIDESRELLYAA